MIQACCDCTDLPALAGEGRGNPGSALISCNEYSRVRSSVDHGALRLRESHADVVESYVGRRRAVLPLCVSPNEKAAIRTDVDVAIGRTRVRIDPYLLRSERQIAKLFPSAAGVVRNEYRRLVITDAAGKEDTRIRRIDCKSDNLSHRVGIGHDRLVGVI